MKERVTHENNIYFLKDISVLQKIYDKTGIDKFFLRKLFDIFYSYLKRTPIKVIVNSYDYEENIIEFRTFNTNISIPINKDVSFTDHLYLLVKELKPFFPSFNVVETFERPLTEQEVLKELEGGLTFDEAMEKKVVITNKEDIVLYKIKLKRDVFYLEVNGEIIETRISGGEVKKVYPLSVFLKDLRLMLKQGVEGVKLKHFIKANSTLLNRIKRSVTIPISFPENLWMENFFLLRKEEFVDKPLEKIDELIYNIGGFTIKFNDRVIKEHCLKIINKGG